MFFVRCPETGGAELAAQYKVGGYLLFGRDFKDKTAQQVRDDIQSYQDASGIPLLIGTDEEGRHGGAGQQQSRTSFPSGSPLPRPCSPRAGWTLILQGRPTEEHDPSGPGGQCQLCAGRRRIHRSRGFHLCPLLPDRDAQATANYVAQVVGVMGRNRSAPS